jgi:formylglycine-generating enzyme required for sulfatase activity
MERPSLFLSCLLLFGLLGVGCEEPEPEPVQLTCQPRDNCGTEFCDQVLIPGGEFTMGADVPVPEDSYWPAGDEGPSHKVHVDAFCIDRYEVTLERYEKCVDKGVCPPDGLEHEQATQTVVNHYPEECWPDLRECKHRAVNAKNYWQAQTYCSWIGGRLCTEAEWERAANGPGPQQRTHPWGDEDPAPELVNIPSTGTGYVENVDICPDGVSEEGVFNLAGNVYEWVLDRYELYEDHHVGGGETRVNPAVPPNRGDDQVVGRGACFFTEVERSVTERTVFPMDFDWG